MADNNSDNTSIMTLDDMVSTAVKFLQNSKVVNSSLAQKQNFLRRKGLTEEQIRQACELSGAYSYHDNVSRISPPLPPSLMGRHLVPLTFFDKLKDTIHNVALFSVVGYGLYKIYQNYIAPYLFGKKKKSIDESLEDLNENLNNSIGELKGSLESVKVEVDKICKQSEWKTDRDLTDMKSDISKVKCLLLSRKQFPNVSNSPVVPPSIPAWQMSSMDDADADRKTEELEEIGSGSGSSEPEHCTKTSDSSLEIILTPKECEQESYNKNSEDKK
ncbi:hypothetical protein WA026_017194 [Henosepilachna vigintioctopunctata]|uniref:Peroxisomal membrane protein PEX14 n=1 Tax=Henosepilachna vigintioctopunctata TaxID=420089 RepID=A0AAW1UG51_9CUCU